jgi:L-ascorbate metabolism protein UlaG (beta-lactamase superfamily)
MSRHKLLLAGGFALGLFLLNAQDAAVRLDSVDLLAGREIAISATAPRGAFFALEVSRDLVSWRTLYSVNNRVGLIEYLDSGARNVDKQFYRITQLDEAPPLEGDHFQTAEGDLVVHPVDHASFVMTWNGLTIYSDPVGGSRIYSSFPKADIVLLTHEHGDHFDNGTLSSLLKDTSEVIASETVFNRISRGVQAQSQSVANGATVESHGISIEVVPAYNSTRGRLNYHPEGVGNGYVLNLGETRVYLSGDTEDIPEMRALQDIDVAFLCMVIPFTMTIDQAASAVKEFKPGAVYPYHYRGSDVEAFKAMVGFDQGVEVRLREWY